jgi:hypothetical protein
MKSSLWLVLVLLSPLSAKAQDRLFLNASALMSMSGYSDLNAYVSHGDGRYSDILEVKLRDTISLVADNAQDTLPIRNSVMGPKYGGPQYLCSGFYTFHFDHQGHRLLNVVIRAGGYYGSFFSMTLDSLPLTAISDSTWSVTDAKWTCSYSCHYESLYLMPNGNNGSDVATGKGETTLATPNALSVYHSMKHERVRIVMVANHAVQFESDDKSSTMSIDIYDAIGRITDLVHFEGGIARVTSLPPGCYFARLTSSNGASEVVKFVVTP